MAWYKVSQVFSFGSQWGDNTVRLVEGNNAVTMIKRVEGILEDSMRVLASHERVLSSGEFNIFSIKHRHLVLKVVEVKQEIHRQQQQSIFSATPSGRGAESIARDVVRLQNQAEIYQQDLLTASRRAQIAEEERFLGRWQPEIAQLAEASTDPTACYSIVIPKPSADDLKPCMAVLRTCPDAGSEGSGDGLIRASLILEYKDKILLMFNANNYSLDESPDAFKDSILGMAQAGTELLTTDDPTNLEGYEVIKTPENEPSWVDSFVNGLARLGVGIGADMV